MAKLKAKGGGKWKYMSEKDMLDISAKFSPYRYVFKKRKKKKKKKREKLGSLGHIVANGE